MNYFLDTEFLEGTQKTWLGRITKPTIDLISIGIVDENGREYYAISKDFNLKEAWNRFDWKEVKEGIGGYQVTRRKKHYWIRENVLRPIFDDLRNKCQEEINESLRVFRRSNMVPNKIYKLLYLQQPTNKFTLKNLRKLIKKHGKSNAQIAEEVREIVSVRNEKHTGIYPNTYTENVRFYTYYGSYDHVVFCWLFGRMIDLPKGFPMYTRDLKQMLDEKADSSKIPLVSRSKDLNIKSHPNYPKQTNEHSALHDARWNRELHKFIQSL